MGHPAGRWCLAVSLLALRAFSSSRAFASWSANNALGRPWRLQSRVVDGSTWRVAKRKMAEGQVTNTSLLGVTAFFLFFSSCLLILYFLNWSSQKHSMKQLQHTSNPLKTRSCFEHWQLNRPGPFQTSWKARVLIAWSVVRVNLVDLKAWGSSPRTGAELFKQHVLRRQDPDHSISSSNFRPSHLVDYIYI